MQENVNYGPDYLYAPSFDNSQKYRVSSTSPNQLPTGIVFNGNYVATVSDVGLIPGKVYAKISGKPAVGTLGNRTIIFEAYNDGGVVTKTINLTIFPEASAWTDVTINDLMRKKGLHIRQLMELLQKALMLAVLEWNIRFSLEHYQAEYR